MTKKDYILIAQAIRIGIEECEKRGYKLSITQEMILIDYIAAGLVGTNPQFSKEKFMLACGIDINPI